MEGTIKLKAGDFLRRLFISKNISVNQVAEKLGKSHSSFCTTLRKNRMTMGTFNEIMKACDEPFVIKIPSTGEEVELEISDTK